MFNHEEATLTALAVAALSLLILLVKLIHCCVKLCKRCCCHRHYSMVDMADPYVSNEIGRPVVFVDPGIQRGANQIGANERGARQVRRKRPTSNIPGDQSSSQSMVQPMMQHAVDLDDLDSLSDDGPQGKPPKPVHVLKSGG